MNRVLSFCTRSMRGSLKPSLLRPLLENSLQTRLMNDGQQISRYPIPEVSSLPEDIQARFAEEEKKAGFLPNVLRCLSHRPDEVRASLNYHDVVMLKENNLSKAEKEMIVVATSAANTCTYCVISHGAWVRIHSKNPLLGDQVAINWKLADLNDRERAILEFATKVGRSETILDEDFKALEQHGLGLEDAWDIGAIAAFFALSNRMAHLVDMRPNPEYYLMGRVPKETN